MAYQYRGKLRDVEPVPVQTIIRPVFDPDMCGTTRGHKQHRKFDESPCRPCKDAFNAYYRDYTERSKAGLVVRKFSPDKCGTMAGYKRHIRHGIKPCMGCRAAWNAYKVDLYARRAA